MSTWLSSLSWCEQGAVLQLLLPGEAMLPANILHQLCVLKHGALAPHSLSLTSRGVQHKPICNSGLHTLNTLTPTQVLLPCNPSPIRQANVNRQFGLLGMLAAKTGCSCCCCIANLASATKFQREQQHHDGAVAACTKHVTPSRVSVQSPPEYQPDICLLGKQSAIAATGVCSQIKQTRV